MTRREFATVAASAAIEATSTGDESMWDKESRANLAGARLPKDWGLIRGGWITIAHPGENLNRRIYADSALQQMCDQLKGKPVMLRLHDGPLSVDNLRGALEDLAGMVTDSRRTDNGFVQVRVNWLSQCPTEKTEAMYLAPAGRAKEWSDKNGANSLYPEDAPITVTDYEAESLEIVGDSAFEHATQL